MNKQAKITTLASAVAALWAGGAVAAIPAVSMSFHVSGASAARAVTPAIIATFCQPGTIARYEYSVKPKDYNLTVCTFKTQVQDPAMPASLAGQSIAVYGRASGGSLFGIKPIVEPKFLTFLSPATCPNTDGVDSTIQQCTTLTGGDPSVGTPSGTAGNVSIIGISDQDPVFGGNVALEVDPAGTGGPADPMLAGERARLNDLAAGNLTAVTVVPAYELVWSVQANSAFPLSNISEISMRGVYTGQYQTVGQLLNANGVASTSTQDTTGLTVCLRTNTSGTAAGQKQLWTGASFCNTPGATSQVDETSDDGNTFSPLYNVVLNSSSGNVESCLNGSVNAIGINSLENAGLAGIKELSIDGVAPTLAAAAKGQYKWKHESTVQYNSNTLNATVAGTAWSGAVNTAIEAASGAGAVGDTRRNDFVTLFTTKVKDPAVINFAVSGLNGILALNDGTNTPNVVFDPANPVSWTSKAGDNCSTPGNAIFP